MLTESDILTALRDCYDPSVPCNIVDLGLIDSITITPDFEAPGSNIPGVPPRHCIHIHFTLTQTDDTANAVLRLDHQSLAGLGKLNYITPFYEPQWINSITPTGCRFR
jgi:metal-sulfur cluster biosynthetic enzyme